MKPTKEELEQEERDKKEIDKIERQEGGMSILLKALEGTSIYTIRDAHANFENPAILWAGGKDSTLMVYLATLALPKEHMLPCILLDTGYEFRETYNFCDNVASAWGLNFIKSKNMEAMYNDINPETTPKFKCCSYLKTENLKKCIEKYKFDAILVGIRWDEHDIRAKEEYFSVRTDPDHHRVHPILHWRQVDVWNYTLLNKLPYNPLYDYNINGKKYKSIGCYTCTQPVNPDAPERSGRLIDKENAMHRLRALGYM